MNPILSNRYYIPDVEARVGSDDTVYLYGSKDIVNDDSYCSNEYQVFSSKDLLHWNASKISFSTNTIKEKTSARLYAPDCIEKDGRYYLLYCLSDGTEGIAESDNPMGPFTDRGVINGIKGIDPSALIEGNEVYYFWGQISLHGAKLDLEKCAIDEQSHIQNILTQERDGFHEGSSIRKIGDNYYLIYTDISRGRATCLGYAISKNPFGPYEKKGIIIDNTGCDPCSWNNHGSIQMIHGQMYVFYHRSTHNSAFSRHVCMEPIEINPDGTINEVEMTSQGIEPYIECTRPLEASAICFISGEAYLCDYSSETQSFEFLTNIHNKDGAYIKYYRFNENVSEFVIFAANIREECYVGVHLDDPQGKEIATVAIGKTMGNYHYREFTGKLCRKISGTHVIYLEFRGGEGKLMNLKSFVFR